jgi:uncharacterized membrane protein
MKFIKTTILGGLVFMVPLVIVAAVFGKAIEIMTLVAKPMGNRIPVDSIRGVAVGNLLALLVLALLCFVTGLIAKSKMAKKVYHSLDSALLAIPGYAFIKGFTDSMTDSQEAAKFLIPVFVRFDDYEQIGFELERLKQGKVVVYLPGAPDPRSGSVVYLSADRVKRLDITVAQASNNLRHLGRGSQPFLEQV